jgi:hypothetical protein
MKFDLHLHTRYSEDSELKPEKIVERAMEEGLDGIAVTDHNTMSGYRKVKEIGGKLKVIGGEEIKTTEGEIIGLFLNKEIKPGSPEKVISDIKEQDGIVIIPHPFDRLRGSRFKNPENIKEWVDGVEVLNSRVIFESDNEKARKFADENNLIKTAGSDAHTSGEIGSSWIETDAERMEELKKKIKSGEIEIRGSRSSPYVHLSTFFLNVKNLVLR